MLVSRHSFKKPSPRLPSKLKPIRISKRSMASLPKLWPWFKKRRKKWTKRNSKLTKFLRVRLIREIPKCTKDCKSISDKSSWWKARVPCFLTMSSFRYSRVNKDNSRVDQKLSPWLPKSARSAQISWKPMELAGRFIWNSTRISHHTRSLRQSKKPSRNDVITN